MKKIKSDEEYGKLHKKVLLIKQARIKEEQDRKDKLIEKYT